MKFLIGGLQNYAWGSTTLLAQLRGEPASAQPEAEIWYGAHPGAATMCGDGTSLIDHIETHPVEFLGQSVVDRFGAKLPFLLKLLAAGSPLSIQAHPSIEQARAGFAAEEAAGIERNAPHRSFRDDNHKPELICALTSFDALVGFRDPEATQDFWNAVGFEDSVGFDALAARLAQGPKHVVEDLLSSDVLDATGQDISTLVSGLVDACRSYDGERWRREASLIVRLAEKYRHDPGVVIASMLNYVTLEPGEALYLGAGHMHAYVEGLAVELMANSDNVLRGGLTPKYVDVENLLDVVLPDIHPAQLVEMQADGRYLTPATEFELRRLRPIDGAEVDGPCIVLCTTGTVDVSTGAEQVTLAPTEAVWLSDGECAQVTGNANVAYRAGVGRATTLTVG